MDGILCFDIRPQGLNLRVFTYTPPADKRKQYDSHTETWALKFSMQKKEINPGLLDVYELTARAAAVLYCYIACVFHQWDTI